MFNKFNKKKKFSKEDESALLNDILNDNLEDDIEEDYEKDIDDTDDEIGLINDILNEEENEENKESNDDNEDLHSVNNKKKKEKSDSEYYKEEYLKDKKNDKKKNDEDDDSNEELEVLNINDIENIAGKRKRISSKKSKNNKMYLLLIGIVVIVVGVLIAMMLLPGNENTEVVDPSIKIEDTSNLVQDIVIEEKKSEITQYGEVKRILSNKIIIIPDNSESDTIYFINDKTKVDVNTFLEIGDRIEYTYIIEDQNYIFINFKDIYSGIVNQKYDGKLIIQLDNKDYSIVDTLEKDDKEEETENVDNAENSENLEDNNTENEELKEEIISVIGDEFSYGISLKTIAEQIENGDKIEFCLDDSNNITSISNIIKKNKDNNYESTPKYAKREKVDIITNEFNKDDFSNEYSVIEKNEGIDHFEFIKETDFVNNSVKFYNSFEDPIWIRFAWRDSSLLRTDEIENNVFEKMPSVNDVTISFITPSGKTISSENIEKENIGRMWLDGNIVNFAIRNPEAGEWTLKADKNSGFSLGETNFHLMKLTGFITIEKFGINNLDNGLVEFIWNVGGVEDEFMEIEISLVGEKYSKSIYKASSKTSNLRNVDHCILDLSEIPKGTYSVIAKVKDLDIITHKDDPENVSEHTRQVSAETIVHRKTVGQLEIN